MSLQTIINISGGLQIDRRKVVGIQYTRNEIPRINLTPTMNPWRFTVTVPNSLRYDEARTILESLDTLDRYNSEIVTFANNPNLSWIFRYQGQMNQTQVNTLRVQSFVGNQLVLTGLPITGPNAILFQPNDLIQIGTHPYPFTSTTQVLRGTNNTVTVTTHRPNIITASVTNSEITVGSSCQFKLFCNNMPTYRLIPGGFRSSGSTVLNNAYIEFSDSFFLYEYLGTV